MSDASANALVELHAAASVVLHRTRHTTHDNERERLRRAIIAVMRDNGVQPPADLIGTPAEALAALRAIIARLKALQVNWTDVVAIVNREPAEIVS